MGVRRPNLRFTEGSAARHLLPQLLPGHDNWATVQENGLVRVQSSRAGEPQRRQKIWRRSEIDSRRTPGRLAAIRYRCAE